MKEDNSRALQQSQVAESTSVPNDTYKKRKKTKEHEANISLSLSLSLLCTHYYLWSTLANTLKIETDKEAQGLWYYYL